MSKFVFHYRGGWALERNFRLTTDLSPGGVRCLSGGGCPHQRLDAPVDPEGYVEQHHRTQEYLAKHSLPDKKARRLAASGFTVYTPHQVLPNDRIQALSQVAVLRALLAQGY